MIKRQFLPTHLHDPLLGRSASDKLKAEDLLVLPDFVRTRKSLNILVWVKVRIEDNDCVGSGEVDSNTSGAGGK